MGNVNGERGREHEVCAEDAAAREAGGDRRAAARALAGLEQVMAARDQAQGNVNPQLLLAVLLDDLAALEAA